jgi:hypothetical protein
VEFVSDIKGSLKPTKMRSSSTKSSANSNPINALEREAAEQKRITDAKAAFQDAVYDVFRREGNKPSATERARLRDLLANISCPRDVADDLRGGAVQLDTTEYLNFFLASVMPEENRVAVVSKVKWGAGAQKEERSRTETQTKLEFSFPTGGQKANLQAMLAGYQNEEDLKGANQYEITPGKKVDAKKNLKLQVTNPEAEIVISLKRFEYEIKGGELSRKKIDDPVSLDDISLPLQADPSKMQKYRATSFIVHQGGLGGGHYIAYVQESDEQWYCYNDSSKTEVSDDDLIEAKTQAYVVKYSPIDERSKCRLPESQGKNGTANGGDRCWANAAFAFALSMTSLHDDKHKRGVETEAPKIQNARRIEKITAADATSTIEEIGIERHVEKILNLDEKSDLKAVLQALESIKPEIRESLDARLEEIGAVSTSGLLQNAAQTYLLKLTDKQDDKKTDAILGLSRFFSDERNREDVLKIIDAVDGKEAAFIADPQQFCANVINASDHAEAKEKLKPKPKQFVTTADLCYEAIAEGNAENLKKLLPHAITQDKDFLTNALCCAVMSKKADIANLLINDYEAKQDKQSPLYQKTAKEIDDESAGKKILSSESKTEDGVAPPPPVLFDRWKIPYPAKFEKSETGQSFSQARNNLFSAFKIMPLRKEWPLEFLSKISVAAVDLALSIAWGVWEYVIPAAINTPAYLIGIEKEVIKEKKGLEEIGEQKVENSRSATVTVEAKEKRPPEVTSSVEARTEGAEVLPRNVVTKAKAEPLKIRLSRGRAI